MALPDSYNLSDLDEYALAKCYVGGVSSKVVDAKLDPARDSVWLINPASSKTYNICPVRQPRQGYYCVAFDGRMAPVNGKYGADWLVLLDVDGSVVIVVKAAEFCQAIDLARGQGQPAGAGLMIQPKDGYILAWVTVAFLQGHDLAVRSKSFTGKDSFEAFRTKALIVPDRFCHLHVHSTYSLLDGVSDVEAIAKVAAANGQPGIALTDHGFMFGTWKFYKACKDVGVQPVLGCEFYLVDNVKEPYKAADESIRRFEYHQTVLAMNNRGWENLCQLATRACRDHFYYVPRIDHQMLFDHQEGLIVLSGCFKGPVAWHLQQHDPSLAATQPWVCYDPARSRQTIEQYRQVFGDRYFVEVQAIDFDQYNAAVPEIVALAGEMGVPCVATNDCHYEREEDAAVQCLLTRIGKGSAGDRIGQAPVQRGPYFIKRRAQIQHPSFTPEMYDRTVEIMERCSVDIDFTGYLFPEYQLDQDPDWSAFQKSRTGSSS